MSGVCIGWTMGWTLSIRWDFEIIFSMRDRGCLGGSGVCRCLARRVVGICEEYLTRIER